MMLSVPGCFIEGRINQQFNFLKSKVQNSYDEISHEYVANQIDFHKLLHILLLLLCLKKFALCGEKFKQCEGILGNWM